MVNIINIIIIHVLLKSCSMFMSESAFIISLLIYSKDAELCFCSNLSLMQHLVFCYLLIFILIRCFLSRWKMGSTSAERLPGVKAAKGSETKIEIKIKTLDSQTYTLRVDKQVISQSSFIFFYLCICEMNMNNSFHQTLLHEQRLFLFLHPLGYTKCNRFASRRLTHHANNGILGPSFIYLCKELKMYIS